MKPLRMGVLASAVLLLSLPCPVAAQLRPLEPLPAETFSPGGWGLSVRGGVGIHADQRASLAGTQGSLTEVGNITLVWRTGRVAIEAGGTALRLFTDESTFSEPTAAVDPASGPRRRDVGDFRVATSVRVTPESWRPVGFIRFGTRLPTTDDTIGLDRDRTDFFSIAGVHWMPGPWRLAGELGLGINGTHHSRLEQADVLIYSASAEYRLAHITPGVLLVGHADGMPGYIRGTEELSEIRAGARLGGRTWISAHWVHGLTDFSPRRGLLVSAGWSR